MVALALLGGLFLFSFASSALSDEAPRYLAFQIFTVTGDSDAMRHSFPSPSADWRELVSDLRTRIGVAESGNRHLGFIFGPLAFDNTDEQVRKLIASGFDIALETGVAVGFHIDEQKFWGRLKELNTPASLEWLDWKGTPNTGRLLDWSPPHATKIMPQLCINSEGVKSAVNARAALIGKEIVKGIRKLHAAGKDDLFLGVIAGWETEIGRDFDTGKNLGYCALTNAGYSEKNPPPDMNAALSKVVQEFIALWARALTDEGVPRGKVYSHVALVSENSPASAYCDFCVPGVSIYPFPGLLEAWRKGLAEHGNPPWASCEGSPLDPRKAERGDHGMSMEGYLGNLFNHGAVLVNLFGWGLGDNPFRRIVENDDALAAYRKFLRGEKLSEAPTAGGVLPAGLWDKIHKVQAALPGWLQVHGPAQVEDNANKLQHAVEEQRFNDAAAAADALLKTMGQ
jgi:hypothetical protein